MASSYRFSTNTTKLVTNKNIKKLNEFKFNAYDNLNVANLNAELESLVDDDFKRREQAVMRELEAGAREQFARTQEQKIKTQQLMEKLETILPIDATIIQAESIVNTITTYWLAVLKENTYEYNLMKEIADAINIHLSLNMYDKQKFNKGWASYLHKLVAYAIKQEKQLQQSRLTKKGGSRKHKYARKTRRRRV